MTIYYLLRREDKKEKLYKECQKKIKKINDYNEDDYNKYSTASVDMGKRELKTKY
jgi:hypothetical protein